MWCCTMALNGLLQKGVITDWSVHGIAHELTAYFGIDHARTLAIIAPSHYRYTIETKKEKLAQYASRVWNISEGNTFEKAQKGIDVMEKFFQSLGIQTKLSQYTDNYQIAAERVEKAFTERGWLGIGEHRLLTPNDAKNIVEKAY